MCALDFDTSALCVGESSEEDAAIEERDRDSRA